MKLRTVLVLLSIMSGFSSLACEDCDPHQSQFQFRNLVQQIAIVGKENRQTYPEYARNKKSRLSIEDVSGTVEFHCTDATGRKDDGGGGNLVSSNGCFALDSHQFMIKDKDKNCIRFMRSEEIKARCYFQTIDSNGSIRPEMHPLDPYSLKLPQESSNCIDQKVIGNDWAVIQARDTVSEDIAKPYPIFDASVFGSVENDFANVDFDNTWDVTVIAARANNFRAFVPTICDGAMGSVETQTDSNGVIQILHTNSCSSGDGSSGAGVVVRGRNGKIGLMGIVTWGKGREMDGKPYGKMNFSAGTVIQGEFLRAINACKKTPQLNR